MKKSKKPPSWRKKHLIILTILGIFLTILPVFESKSMRANANLAAFSSQEITESLVIIEGNSFLPIANPSTPNSQIRKIKVVVTAYSSSPWQTDSSPYITAAGTWVKDGIIANNFLSFGTKVRIPELYGDRVFVVEDRMHWTKSNYHFDVWFASYGEALNFGTKRTYIEILES